MLNRRELLTLATLAPLAATRAGAEPASAFADLEHRGRGRLGVAALDTHTTKRIAWRAAERFPMCSTFKLLLAAAVLHNVDVGREQLTHRVAYAEADLLEHAPVTRAHLKNGSITIEELCAAAIQQSDNTAANLLLTACGGPTAVTRYAGSLGDRITRLDRIEPDLNSALPGDPRDTTSPKAMLDDTRSVLLGDALSSASRELLTSWLLAAETGLTLIRAALPAGWKAGDKSGRGGNGSINDVAILWPPERAPLLVAVYFTASPEAEKARTSVVAEAARIALGALS
ncbi:MAG TPA: class A beta-lactamase [Candidatus Dormibacteraeota bacterium]|nr:class A beta-lactamase [Candidatus Dormibacteraeota bacterium]